MFVRPFFTSQLEGKCTHLPCLIFLFPTQWFSGHNWVGFFNKGCKLASEWVSHVTINYHFMLINLCWAGFGVGSGILISKYDTYLPIKDTWYLWGINSENMQFLDILLLRVHLVHWQCYFNLDIHVYQVPLSQCYICQPVFWYDHKKCFSTMLLTCKLCNKFKWQYLITVEIHSLHSLLQATKTCFLLALWL